MPDKDFHPAVEVHTTDSSISSIPHLKHDALLSRAHDHAQSKWEAIRRRPKALLWIGVVIFILCMQGFDIAVGNSVVGVRQFRKDFGVPFAGNYVLEAKWQSALSGVPVATSVSGALLGSWLSDRVGRKWLLVAGICNTFIGTGLELSATHFGVFLAGKTIMAFSLGIFNVVCLAYVSELSPLAIRGITTAACDLSLSVGPVITVGIGYHYASLPNRWAYRGLICGQLAFATLSLIMSLFLPESPWYLVHKKDIDGARKILARLGYNAAEAEEHLLEIRITDELSHQATASASFIQCFRGTNLRRTGLTALPFIAQGVCGLLWLALYQVYYYELAGNSVQRSFALSIAGGISLIAGCVTSWFVIDRIGRRTLLITGSAMLCIIMFLIGALTTVDTVHSLRAAIAFFIIWYFVYSLCLGSVAYAVGGEIPTNRLRPKTIALAIVVQQSIYLIQAFVLPYIFNPNEGNLQGKTAFIYGCLMLVMTVLFGIFQPETANRSFAELDEMFARKVKSRDFGKFVSDSSRQEKEVLGVDRRRLSVRTGGGV